MIETRLCEVSGGRGSKSLGIIGMIIFLFSFLTTNTVLAEDSYAQHKRLTLELTNITMRDVFNEIEKNSEYIFFYSDEVNVSTSVAVKVTDRTIDEIMKQVLKDTDYTYTVSDRQVFVKKAEVKTASLNVVQQQTRITGVVVDTKGEPVIGANVSLKSDAATGTITNIDGEFSLNVAEGSVLTVSYIGFITQEVKATKKRMQIVLAEDAELLDEVVITAFGTGQKKESVVGSIQTVRPSDLVVPSTNLSTSFAGRLAGVVAYQRSGEPGNNGADFYIRGVSTMSGITSPLIILDGVEVSKGDLNAVDPEVIESFSILKDATATAMYGTRGANGVMIIKTKSGADTEKPIIGVRVEAFASMPTQKTKFANGADYMRLFNEAVTSQGTGDRLFTNEQITNTMAGTNPYVFPNVDWYDEIFKDMTFNQRVNFNIRGGTKKITYFMNLGVNHENGMLQNRSKDFFSYNTNINLMKYNFQNNIDFHMSKTSTISLHLNVQLADKTTPNASVSDIYGAVMNANPVDYPIFFPDNDVKWVKWGALSGGNQQGAKNPMAELVKGYNNEFESTVLANIDFHQKLDFITEGLSFKTLISFKNWNKSIIYRTQEYNKYAINKYWKNENGTYEYELGNINSPEKRVLNTTKGVSGDRRIYGQAYFDYTRSFGDHNVNGMLLANIDQYNNNNPNEEKDGELVLNSILVNSLPKRKLGYAARLSYNYADRYMLELNAGYNGSENFAGGHRWGFFPSVAVGWNISQEAFFEPLKNVVDHMKVRASYGLVGNDQIRDGSYYVRFIYMSQINLQGASDFKTGYGNSTNSLKGPSYDRYQNTAITWEVGKKLNVGLDLRLFNALSINIDGFYEKRENIFQQKKSIPNYLGTASTKVYGNLAKVKNWGFDASADYGKQINRDWSVQFKGTFTFARNEVLEYNEAPGLRAARSQIGKRLNTYQGYVSNGLYIDWGDIANNPASSLGNIAIAPGDIKYVDQPDAYGNYDGRITADDQVYMGYPTVPEIVYGFGPSIQYKKWDFSFFFQGVTNTSLMMSGFHPFGTQYNRNVLKFVADDYWSPTNQNPHAKYPRLTKDENNHNTANSTFWLRDASFLKLKNAEIGYSLLRNVRFYLSGSNLLTFSPFKHWDPEMGGGAGLKYPTQRVVNFGVQMTFK